MENQNHINRKNQNKSPGVTFNTLSQDSKIDLGTRLKWNIPEERACKSTESPLTLSPIWLWTVNLWPVNRPLLCPTRLYYIHKGEGESMTYDMNQSSNAEENIVWRVAPWQPTSCFSVFELLNSRVVSISKAFLRRSVATKTKKSVLDMKYLIGHCISEEIRELRHLLPCFTVNHLNRSSRPDHVF